MLARALLGQMLALDPERILIQGLLNAAVGISLYHFLDRLRETA